jgi:hypothetical protein
MAKRLLNPVQIRLPFVRHDSLSTVDLERRRWTTTRDRVICQETQHAVMASGVLTLTPQNQIFCRFGSRRLDRLDERIPRAIVSRHTRVIQFPSRGIDLPFLRPLAQYLRHSNNVQCLRIWTESLAAERGSGERWSAS